MGHEGLRLEESDANNRLEGVTEVDAMMSDVALSNLPTWRMQCIQGYVSVSWEREVLVLMLGLTSPRTVEGCVSSLRWSMFSKAIMQLMQSQQRLHTWGS